jgi:hypothetical protein
MRKVNFIRDMSYIKGLKTLKKHALKEIITEFSKTIKKTKKKLG